MKNKQVNAGVHNSNGIEFQKHCTLYFLFEKYNEIKEKRYFICIEHHEDSLFCFQNSEGLVYLIEAYQLKKASKPWGMSAELCDLIIKMTEVGLDLYEDSMPKSESYKHTMKFVSNDSITLNNGKSGKDKKSETINASNMSMQITDLDEEIRDNIQKKLKLRSESIDELKNISIRYIDLPKSTKEQKNSLVGKFQEIFTEEISDYRAAVDTLLDLLRQVENSLNQGNIAGLMDESKRVSSESINSAIGIITTKGMAFILWRQEKKDICNKLGIPIRDRNKFELDFENSFDRFKDMEQVEYIRIVSFVEDNMRESLHTDEVECIEWLYGEFQQKISSQLEELSIKAAIFAAFIEVREKL